MKKCKYCGSTYETERRSLLERCLLESKSNWIRDEAMRGISYLDNPQSLDAVEKAIVKETLPRLKRYMMRVAQRLREKEEM